MNPIEVSRYLKNPAPGKPPVGQVELRYSREANSMVVRDSNGADTPVGGVPTFEELADAETADLPNINQPLADALDGKSPAPYAEEVDSVILLHDGSQGVEQTLAQSGTRNVRPGPGVFTAKTLTSPSLCRYADGRMAVNHAAASGAGSEGYWSEFALVAGLTVTFRLIPGFRSGITSTTIVGWSTDGSPNGRKGVVVLASESGATPRNPKVQVAQTSASDDYRDIWNNYFVPGQEVAVAIRFTSANLIEYFMQSPVFDGVGCSVGSENWFKIATTSGVTLSGNVRPMVYHQYLGVTEVLDVKVFSQWESSPRHQQFDYSRGKIGVHVPALMKDPVTGLMVCAFNNGTNHVGTDVAIRASVRLANGQWTSPVTIVAAPGGGAGVHIGSLSNVNGQLWLTHWLAAGATDGGIYRRRILTIDADTGAITVGSEQVMSGLEGVTRCLSFAPIITTDAGTLLFFYANFGDTVSSVARSTDGGATWSLVNMTPGGVPSGATAIYEPYGQRESGGAIGVYLRASTGGNTYYQRSTDDGATWTTPVPVYAMPQPTVQSGGRVSGATGPDGKNYIIFNDDRSYRRAISVVEVEDNAVLRNQVTRIFDPYPDTGTDVAILTHYPAIAVDGDDIVAAWANQTGTDSSIQLHTLQWTTPIPTSGGGTGSRAKEVPSTKPRELPVPIINIPYALASPTPSDPVAIAADRALGRRFLVVLVGSTATLGAPTNGFGGDELELIVRQGGAGSYTLAFNAIFVFNGITTTLQTAVGAENTFVFRFSGETNKWILKSFT